MNGPEPWAAMFSSAVAARPSDSSDLVPFWLLPIEGGAQIERHVLASPLSRDRAKLMSPMGPWAPHPMFTSSGRPFSAGPRPALSVCWEPATPGFAQGASGPGSTVC